jgi:hypothetical protein
MFGPRPIFLWITQGIITLAVVTLAIVQIMAWHHAEQTASDARTLVLEPRYEYKTVSIIAGALDRTGSDALKAARIEVDERELSKLGSQGWEVIGSFLETETAFPNFGSDKYVAGLQPNVRPQRLVMILRHRIG